MNTLEARSITFAYPGQKPLFEEFDLEVKSNERLGLKAASGRGKTTLCKLLAGYLQPTSGSILLNGTPLPQTGASPVQLIGQHPETALDPRLRLSSSLEEAGPLDHDLLGRLGIKKVWLSRYPHELSGGELQRFCIARALMANPHFLIADEITTMLDAITQVRIWDTLFEEAAARELGIVLVTHSPALSKRVATHLFKLV